MTTAELTLELDAGPGLEIIGWVSSNVIPVIETVEALFPAKSIPSNSIV